MDAEHGLGYSQNLQLIGMNKLSDIAVDWVSK